jgi:hypothetical protein
MGMPRKGSRKVVVDDITYLWRVSSTQDWHLDSVKQTVRLTVQRDEERPGRVAQFRLVSRQILAGWEHDNGFRHDSTLHPSEVEVLVQHALDNGWDPADRGASFKVPPCGDEPDENLLGLRDYTLEEWAS